MHYLAVDYLAGSPRFEGGAHCSPFSLDGKDYKAGNLRASEMEDRPEPEGDTLPLRV